MRVTYNALVQKDVNRILKKYDLISSGLGDEFWNELMSQITETTRNPGRGHPVANDLRRVNLVKFPYHFLYRKLPDRIRVTVVRHHGRHPGHGLARR